MYIPFGERDCLFLVPREFRVDDFEPERVGLSDAPPEVLRTIVQHPWGERPGEQYGVRGKRAVGVVLDHG